MTMIPEALVSCVPFKDTTKAQHNHFEVSKWDLPHLPPQFYSRGQRVPGSVVCAK